MCTFLALFTIMPKASTTKKHKWDIAVIVLTALNDYLL